MRFFFIFISSIFIFLNSSQSSEIKGEKDFVATTLSGENFDLKNLRGKVVIVNFWAQWCPNCLEEMKILEELYKEHQAQGLEIIGVSVDPKKFTKNVLQHAKNVTYKNALLADVAVNNFPEVVGLPTSYILGRNGATKETLITIRGNVDKKSFEDLLRPML